jgi:RNA-directed DNA polymerase
VNLVRYADDFVVTGDSKELLESMVKPWIVEFLRERGLQFSEEKTKIVHIDEGFDFLGWNFRKYDGKMLIKPSKKNVKAFYSKVSEVIGSSLSVPTELLIRKLNPVLRGWAEYHKGVVAKATFSRLDHLIYWRLMKWGRRRHPRKSGKWVYDHYWPQLGSRRAMAVHLPDQEWGSEVAGLVPACGHENCPPSESRREIQPVRPCVVCLCGTVADGPNVARHLGHPAPEAVDAARRQVRLV